MSHENGAHFIECSLTIDESLSTKGFYNSKRIPVSINQIRDLRGIEILLRKLIHHCLSNEISDFSNNTLKLVTDATEVLNLAIDGLSKSELEAHNENNKLPAIQFIHCQLKNLYVKRIIVAIILERIQVALIPIIASWRSGGAVSSPVGSRGKASGSQKQ